MKKANIFQLILLCNFSKYVVLLTVLMICFYICVFICSKENTSKSIWMSKLIQPSVCMYRYLTNTVYNFLQIDFVFINHI